MRKLSQYTGLHPETIDNYEIGKGEISLKEMLKIAKIFGIKPDILLASEPLL